MTTITKRSQVDVWALGNLLFALAFQRHPFDADPPNLQILNGRCAAVSNHICA